jgi:hypothetical protein
MPVDRVDQLHVAESAQRLATLFGRFALGKNIVENIEIEPAPAKRRRKE